MNCSLYPLNCPLCPHKLTFVSRDGELLLYRCAEHGLIVLSSDARIWPDELPEPNTLRPRSFPTEHLR